MREKTHKTIFLDFDGVLHPTSAKPESLFIKAIDLVKIVMRYKPSIVISSSWRFHFPEDEILLRLPQELGGAVVGFTGEAHIGRHARWHEIKAYCAKRQIYDWVALDDSTFEFPTPCRELIACNPNTGLENSQIEQLVAWLESSKSPFDTSTPSE